MGIVAKRTIAMVKQSPFQQDLFDFKYIEDQVANIKKSVKETNNIEDERSLTGILDEQLSVLHDIQYLLSEIDHNTKRKKGWLNFK